MLNFSVAGVVNLSQIGFLRQNAFLCMFTCWQIWSAFLHHIFVAMPKDKSHQLDKKMQLKHILKHKRLRTIPARYLLISEQMKWAESKCKDISSNFKYNFAPVFLHRDLKSLMQELWILALGLNPSQEGPESKGWVIFPSKSHKNSFVIINFEACVVLETHLKMHFNCICDHYFKNALKKLHKKMHPSIFLCFLINQVHYPHKYTKTHPLNCKEH